VANHFGLFGVLLSLVLVGGCSDGPDLAPVTGKVTLDGKPIPFGYVIFQPEKGQLSQGEIKDGQFTMSTRAPDDGATIGSHVVSVLCFEGHSPQARAAHPAGQMSLGRCLVPLDYTRSGSSGLTVEVPPEGKTDVTFELSSKGPGR
jgi:hypothetical protein